MSADDAVPREVTDVLLWRAAQAVLARHWPNDTARRRGTSPMCRQCRVLWPCRAYTFAREAEDLARGPHRRSLPLPPVDRHGSGGVPDLGDVVLIAEVGQEPAPFRVIGVAPLPAHHLHLTGWYLDADPLVERTLRVPATAIRPYRPD
ncbi:hypothetical protein [Actinocatenispora sera]|uniref:Uncharacterized protein n=1 Tax=Actinocatenispora sera TaxID=390989 RepID=A0A810KZV6_9ACTN|nr:hypothetical protein [Actinocatenispora sera]BCJ28713.1 hypothetical protein Asera_28210 [Actinocatenispora sera]